MFLSSNSRDDLHYPYGKGMCITKTDENFFEEEMKGGCKVVFFGTYEIDGDFGTFSKVICELKFPKEQREMFSDDDEEIAYFEKFAKLLKSNDSEVISVDFDLIEEK